MDKRWIGGGCSCKFMDLCLHCILSQIIYLIFTFRNLMIIAKLMKYIFIILISSLCFSLVENSLPQWKISQMLKIHLIRRSKSDRCYFHQHICQSIHNGDHGLWCRFHIKNNVVLLVVFLSYKTCSSEVDILLLRPLRKVLRLGWCLGLKGQ